MSFRVVGLLIGAAAGVAALASVPLAQGTSSGGTAAGGTSTGSTAAGGTAAPSGKTAAGGAPTAKATATAAPKAVPTVTYAAPVRLKAGEAWMGDKRLYPSPVLHDVNGDGLKDVVIGDLPGQLTVALRLAGDGSAKFGPDTKMQTESGAPLKFHNW